MCVQISLISNVRARVGARVTDDQLRGSPWNCERWQSGNGGEDEHHRGSGLAPEPSDKNAGEDVDPENLQAQGQRRGHKSLIVTFCQ